MANSGDVVDGRTARWAHRRDELFTAAMEYVLDHGVADLTLRPLADGIGVTITTLIRQFGSKDELVMAINREIHDQLLADLREDPELAHAGPIEVLSKLWNRWLDPSKRREYGLLFELYALALRAPLEYRWFLDSVVRDWLRPIEEALLALGYTHDRARTTATIVLALVRGLHLDLAATDDSERVNAAFEHAISLLTVGLRGAT
ncbi:TetR/AcrR family transcriptional regulator [Hoyosella subflava]|uniref:Putative TetR transcriptional regulator n=1 Tax=Hoyosella subflava (strain DSM 45089 / JCM 17490 / NBRC 109087 / DQS3-9A1) TaxID=443218 RepID=F6EQI4_HOYSD|nr:TetR/AcrR family transcriptional regulator [Hoyosella subflava]AEF40669.1 Putative TetR transcriptional regulator [Hoyosella subflava DQS3-9A1]